MFPAAPIKNDVEFLINRYLNSGLFLDNKKETEIFQCIMLPRKAMASTVTIEVDVTELHLGDSLQAENLILDDTLTLVTSLDATIVSITHAALEIEPEVEEEELEFEEGAEDEEGAEGSKDAADDTSDKDDADNKSNK